MIELMFETVTDLRERLGEVVAGFDPALVDGARAARLVEEFAAIERLAGAGRVLAARRVAESGAWKRDGDRSAAHWMARKTGTSVGAAVGTPETARRLEELPATEDALRTGLLSGPQAEEIASAAAADPDAEDQLLDVAATEGLVGLRERCRRVRAAACADETARHRAIHASRYLRHREADGAFRMELRSTVDVGGEILAALEPYRERIFAQARTAGRRDRAGRFRAAGDRARARRPHRARARPRRDRRDLRDPRRRTRPRRHRQGDGRRRHRLRDPHHGRRGHPRRAPGTTSHRRPAPRPGSPRPHLCRARLRSA